MNDIPRSLQLKYHTHWLGEFATNRDYFKKKKEEAHLEIIDYLKRQGPREVLKPEVYENISADDFLRFVIPAGKPAILKGLAKNWACCEKWRPEYFARNFKDYPLVVTNMHADRGGSNEELTMSQYVNDISSGERKYARFSRIMHDHPHLKDDFDMKILMGYKNPTDFWVATQFFMGPPTTFTYIHCAFINNLFVQAYGTKKWLIYTPKYNAIFSPPVDRAPTFRSDKRYEIPSYEEGSIFNHLDVYDFFVEQGDVLYNPPFHWHYVTNHTMSISLSFRLLSIMSALRSSKALSALTAFATNPPAFEGLYKTWKGTNFLNFYASKKTEAVD